jgi:hypothetical protein
VYSQASWKVVASNATLLKNETDFLIHQADRSENFPLQEHFVHRSSLLERDYLKAGQDGVLWPPKEATILNDETDWSASDLYFP